MFPPASPRLEVVAPYPITADFLPWKQLSATAQNKEVRATVLLALSPPPPPKTPSFSVLKSVPMSTHHGRASDATEARWLKPTGLR